MRFIPVVEVVVLVKLVAMPALELEATEVAERHHPFLEPQLSIPLVEAVVWVMIRQAAELAALASVETEVKDLLELMAPPVLVAEVVVEVIMTPQESLHMLEEMVVLV